MSAAEDLKLLYKDAEARGDREFADQVLTKLDSIKTDSAPSGITDMYQKLGSPQGLMPQGNITEEPYLAGIGRKFTEMGGALRQTFSNQAESDKIATGLADDEAAIKANVSPQDYQRYSSGRNAGTVAEIATGMRFIPAMKAGGMLGRAAYNSSIAAVTALSTVPGDVGDSNFDRAFIPALVGGGLSAGVEVGLGLRKPVQSLFASRMEKSANQPIARKGASLVDEMSIGGRRPLMTLAEETQDPKLLSYQKSALASAKGQEIGSKFENIQRAQQEKLLKDIGDASPDDVATQTGDVVNRKIKALFNIRRDNADRLYGEVAKAGQVNSAVGKTKVPPVNMNSMADEIEGSYPGAVKAMREANMFPRYGNVDEFIALEARLRTIKNKGGIIVPKNPNAFTGQDKYIAGKLHNALLEDMDTASKAGVFPADFNNKLKTAINQYKTDSAAVRSIEGTRIGKLITANASPEKVADAFSAMKPGEVKDFLSWADEFGVPVRDKVFKYMVGSALDKAKNEMLSQPGIRAFDRATVFRNMGMSKEKSDLLLTDPETKKAFANAVELMKRTDKEIVRGTGESLAQKASATASIAGGAASKHIESAAIFGPREFFRSKTGDMLAAAMFDPNGRKAMQELLKQRLTSREAAKNFAILSGLIKEEK